MTEKELAVAKLIVDDVKQAYKRECQEDITTALNSVKRVFNSDKTFNIEILKYLRQHGMGLIWHTKKECDHVDQRLGLRYKEQVFEISVTL